MYKVLAFYDFTPIQDPHGRVKKWLAYFKGQDVRGRIYMSEEGINAQMSTHESIDCNDWILEQFPNADIKMQMYDEHPFARLQIKYREQLVALDQKVDVSNCAEHVSAKQWREMLDEGDLKTLVIDVRNEYEWEVGHFEGATQPKMHTFREFPSFAEKIANEVDKDTRIMMYCTGGIRCELFSPMLIEKGFNKVYQLKGGVIRYGLEEGSKHWKGKLFVFDDRMAIPLSEEETETISHCHACGCPAETFYNCAHMDCNELFISCESCADKLHGCCSEACTHAKRLRKFEKTKRVRPYRRLSAEEKEELSSR